MSNLITRLSTRLEPILAAPDPRPAISSYHNMPYALFRYDPEEEFELRRQVTMLHTRLEQVVPLYPELRACTAPSAARILELFSDLTRHELHHDGQIVQTFHPELSPLHAQVLELLQIPTTSYTPETPSG